MGRALRYAHELNASRTDPSRFETAGVFLAASASVLYFFRAFFLSGFDRISGDLGDARYCIVILEHWRAVAAGHAALRDPNFFAPYHGVLGYSVALFLYVPPYLLLRASGLDRYLAFEWTLIAVRLFGFLLMYALLRRKLRFAPFPSLAGAALFTAANIAAVTGTHVQLWLVSFVPGLAWLVIHYFEFRWTPRRWVARSALYSAAVLLALMFFSDFYTAYFSVLAGGAAGAGGLGREMARRPAALAARLRRHGRDLAADAAIAAAVFAAALVPFFYVYLPVLAITGGRSYPETFSFMRNWRDLLDVGPGNWMWGTRLGAYYARVNPPYGETGLGIPPLSALTAAACLVVFRKRPFVAVTGLASVTLYAITVRFGIHSLWWLLYQAVPGAKGIRAPGRMNHLVVLGVSILCAAAIAATLDWARGRRWAAAAAGGLAVILLAEQANAGGDGFGRAGEIAFFRALAAPPAVCRDFFSVGPRMAGSPFVGQIDAMLVARRYSISTLNGYSGWSPPDWPLGLFEGAYQKRAWIYAAAHGLTEGLCTADIGNGKWSIVDTSHPHRYELGTTAGFGSGGDGFRYEVSGWGMPEPFGSWTDGPRASLLFDVSNRVGSDLLLTVEMHAFLPASRPPFVVTLTVNGHEVADWRIDSHAPQFIERARIPASALDRPEEEIDFDVGDPRSPAEFGVSGDQRKLGVGIHWLRLQRAP